jgi:hypothetical protein
MTRRGNPAVLAGAALVGVVLVIVGIVLAAGHHPRRGPALIVAGVLVGVAGFFVDRRARTGQR